MISLQEKVELKPLTTMRLSAIANFFVSCSSIDDALQAHDLVKELSLPHLFLGGGSNLVVLKAFEGVVIKNEIKGIEIVEEDADSVVIECGAGENWHSFVEYSVKKSWSGIENLALIPGTIGAAPIQNIGAYGVELSDVFIELCAIDFETGRLVSFNKQQCRFGYRDSLFKHYSQRYFITHVIIRLNKNFTPNLSYKALAEYVEVKQKGKNLTPGIIAECVSNIRNSKLPDPAVIPNCGSFFKNPVVTLKQFRVLKTKWPAMPSFPYDDKHAKIPAAWLIEQSGWKGKRCGGMASYHKQPLVLVNDEDATPDDFISISKSIRRDVEALFGLVLENEVNILPPIF